jgi:ABC-type Mn2+/Zn2+ transport system permease subunit
MANIFTDFLFSPDFDFMRSALEAGTVCALLAAAVGYFVVLRQMAFAGHALGHIGFAGACAWGCWATGCRKTISSSA